MATRKELTEAVAQRYREASKSAKIECGKAHFKALAVGEAPAEYRVARTLTELLAIA